MLKQVRWLTKLSKKKLYKVFSQILKNVIHIELFLHSNNIKKINNIKLCCSKFDWQSLLE